MNGRYSTPEHSKGARSTRPMGSSTSRRHRRSPKRSTDNYSGQKGLVIAAIDLAALGDAVRWEPSRNGQLFPHVYGHLMPQSVIAWCPLERHPNSTVRLPTV